MQDLEASKFHPGGWSVGDWHYWPDSGLLKNGQDEVRLSTQLNQVLLLLLENAPDVVTRQQFLEHIWAGKFVNEDALSRTIAELRKVLGDSASAAKYIKTIPKKGYQLTQSVEPIVTKNNRRIKTALLVLGMSVILIMTYWYSQRNTLVQNLQEVVANASRVTAQPGMESQSIVSLDGQWLTYIKNSHYASQIVIQSLSDASLQHVVELARHRVGSPVFLPKQQLVVFIARDQSNCYLKSYHIKSEVFEDLAGCVFHAESRTIEWNEAQQLILFVAKNKQEMVGIHQLSLNSGEQIELTSPTSTSEQDWSPRISPKQKWMSFSRGNHSVRNIWLKNLVTGAEQPLTTGEHYSISHEWYDDEHIVYDSDSGGSRQLWVLNINDKTPRLVGAYGAQHPSFDLKRELMTFQVVSYEANIWMFDTVTEEYNRLVHSTKYDNYPEFSPDGSQFLFSSNRQDRSSIWLYDFAEGKEQLLISIPDAKLTRPVWHSSKHAVLMTINDHRGYGTLVLDLESGQTSELPFGQGHLAAIEYQGEYFALAKSNHLNNRILHLKDQQVSVLPIESVGRFMVLSDGRLVYSKSDQAGLFLYDRKTKQERVLTLELRRTATNLWTVVNQSVYIDKNDEQAGLWKVDVNTGELSFITEHRPYSVGTSLSVNKSEDKILITRTDRAESDILQTKLN
ncbi:MAG: winged helix-turn-helix domain-containing protein [Marinicella sp.]